MKAPLGRNNLVLQNKMKALSAKPVARVGGNGFWDPLRLEAYKLQWALIPNPGPLHESPLGINHNSFKIGRKGHWGQKKTSTPHGGFFKIFFLPHSILIPPKYVFHPGFPCTMGIQLQLSGADSIARRNRDPSQHVTDFDQVLQAGRQKMWAFILLEVLKSILPEQASNLFTSILILPEFPYALKT